MARGGVLLAAALLLATALPMRAQPESRILVQSSPLAGFQFHEGKALWPQMKVGDTLTLVREADNPYDARAVRVEWQGRKLGYVPKKENEAVARQLDRGNPLEARIVQLRKHRDPWKRIEFEIFLKLGSE
jgi:hypothetical protein